MKLKLADKEFDLSRQKNELSMTIEAVNELNIKLKMKSNEVELLLQTEEKLRREMDRNINNDIVLKTQRDKAIKEVEWLRDQLTNRDEKINQLEKYVVKYEDKSLKFAKTIEKLRSNVRSPSPHSHRFAGKENASKNSINAFSPFPISSTKK